MRTEGLIFITFWFFAYRDFDFFFSRFQFAYRFFFYNFFAFFLTTLGKTKFLLEHSGRIFCVNILWMVEHIYRCRQYWDRSDLWYNRLLDNTSHKVKEVVNTIPTWFYKHHSGKSHFRNNWEEVLVFNEALRFFTFTVLRIRQITDFVAYLEHLNKKSTCYIGVLLGRYFERLTQFSLLIVLT